MPTNGITAPAAGAWAGAPVITVGYRRILNASLWLLVACGEIALIEPSPYEFMSIITIGIWFLGGFTIHRFVLTFMALIFLYNFGGFLALLPYLDEPDPSRFMVQSLYLAITAIFFALLFAENTVERCEVCLKAYAFSTVVAALCGIAGYFNIGGTGELFTLYGRAAGTFKDPNVLGSYLIMGALYFIQSLVLGRTRHVLVTLTSLFVVTAGILLSFSRGSWGGFVVATLMTVGFSYLGNKDRRVRRRILIMSAVAIAAATIVLVGLMSIDSVRELVMQRATVTQDYDEGETGRFGNQLHSLPMLLDRLGGFGPLRFRLFFDIEPHNSYVNAFASYGWLGGASFFLLVGLTVFVGFRLALSRSPFSRAAHVFWPSLFVFLVQGFQIDIDHWRHVYLLFGAVWGMETARIRWLGRPVRADEPRPSSGEVWAR